MTIAFLLFLLLLLFCRLYSSFDSPPLDSFNPPSLSLCCLFPPSILSFRGETRKSQPKGFQNLTFSLYTIYESPACTFGGLVICFFFQNKLFLQIAKTLIYILTPFGHTSSEIPPILRSKLKFVHNIWPQNKAKHD